MTDIAILVAEEFERRVNHSRKEVGFEGEQERGLVSCASIMVAQSVKKNIGEVKMQLLKWVKEPKSQIGLAASNGFFSA